MVNINEQVLERINKGVNFLNIGKNNENKKKYFIEVFLDITQNLKAKEETLEVKQNIFDAYRYGYSSWRGLGVKEFLQALEDFVKIPVGVVVLPTKSLIDKYSSYSDRIDSSKFRKEIIDFEDIEITIGELATIKLKELGVEDFNQKVKDILGKQDKALNRQKQIDAYICVRERIAGLRNLLVGGKKEQRYSYSSDKNTDETLKLLLSPEIYNEKLKEVEKELRKLEKELGLKEQKLEFIEIKSQEQKEKESEDKYKEWFNENEEQLREDFEMNSEEDNEMTFDEYVEMVYNESSFDEVEE